MDNQNSMMLHAQLDHWSGQRIMGSHGWTELGDAEIYTVVVVQNSIQHEMSYIDHLAVLSFQTAQDNIDLQTTILSRFDLIFIVKDIRMYGQDKVQDILFNLQIMLL